jgi:predicted CXXCH cytochrome family protein
MSCHRGPTLSVVNGHTPNITMQNFTTGGHGQKTPAFAGYNSCDSCHNALAKHINPIPSTKRLISPMISNTKGSCGYCHMNTGIVKDPFKNFTTTHVTTYKSGAQTMDCKACHDVHGATNLHMLKASINGKTITYTNDSTSFINMTPVGGIYVGLCQVCHTKTKYFNNNSAARQTRHGQTKNCLTCHPHRSTAERTIRFAFQGGGCDSCHGFPPVSSMTGLGVQNNYSTAKLENYTGGGGAHSVAGHLKKTINSVKDTNPETSCLPCHGNFDKNNHPRTADAKPSSIVIKVDTQFKFNKDAVIKYNGRMTDNNHATGTCSNVSCHFQRSPKWSTLK